MNIGGGDGYDGRARTSDSAPEGGPTATRTRLPDGDTGGRPPTRPGRSLVTVVAVIVLLIAAIAFANRGGGGGDDDSATGDNRSGSAPRADSTAPSGEKPVKNKEAGIPSGFPHSRQGAQSAAANYVVALNSTGMFTAAARERIIDTVYAPSVADARKTGLGKVYGSAKFLKRVGLDEDGKAPKGTTFVTRANPVGAKVLGYDDGKAKVAVWYSALFGLAGEDSKRPVTEGWYTNTFDMTWVNGDWKVTDLKQKDGPTPIGKDQAASPAEEMADAVEGFGGFTYGR